MRMIVFALALCAAPLAAQETPPEEGVDLAAEGETGEWNANADPLRQAMAQVEEMFPREPLTPEQEARLPAAERIVAAMIPEGTMGDIMGRMMDDLVRPMMEMGPSPARATAARGLGMAAFELDLDDAEAAELAALFDPAWRDRQEREMAVIPQVMREMMTVMEPPMRKAMSELYAIRFSAAELAEIEAFFSTPTGRRYASESFVMASDPRMIGASMEALPALMASIEDIEARIAEATGDLPERRAYEELDAAERERVRALTGLSEADIRAKLAAPSGDAGEGIGAAAEAAALEGEE